MAKKTKKPTKNLRMDMKIVTLIACLILAGAAPTTEPVYNGPKIAKELREKIAELEATIVGLKADLAEAGSRLEAADNEIAKLSRAGATTQPNNEIEDAIGKRQIVRGMSMDDCERALGKGSRVAQNEDGTEEWRFQRFTVIANSSDVETAWWAIFKEGKVVAARTTRWVTPARQPELRVR